MNKMNRRQLFLSTAKAALASAFGGVVAVSWGEGEGADARPGDGHAGGRGRPDIRHTWALRPP